jgi:hypothetical protein
MDKDAILSSDAAFRAQFDPNSPTFHSGTSDPVPVGMIYFFIHKSFFSRIRFTNNTR